MRYKAQWCKQFTDADEHDLTTLYLIENYRRKITAYTIKTIETENKEVNKVKVSIFAYLLQST